MLLEPFYGKKQMNLLANPIHEHSGLSGEIFSQSPWLPFSHWSRFSSPGATPLTLVDFVNWSPSSHLETRSPAPRCCISFSPGLSPGGALIRKKKELEERTERTPRSPRLYFVFPCLLHFPFVNEYIIFS